MIERQPEEIDYTVALASAPSQRVFPQLCEHALQLILLLFVGFRRQQGLPNLKFSELGSNQHRNFQRVVSYQLDDLR